MRLTLSTAKTTVARALGMCTTDTRLIPLINEATERLLYKGKWKGTYGVYRFCTDQGCITLPRQLETVEKWALCDQPGIVRNDWYEFIEGGYGVLYEEDGMQDTLVDKGMACTFEDITGSSKLIRVISDVAENTTTPPTITLQGYDDNDNWIRTLVGSTWVDGEVVDITSAYTVTTNNFKSLVSVIKEATNGVTRIYEWDVALGVQKALAYYEPDETHPEYRRYLIPGLSDVDACCAHTDSEGNTCEPCADDDDKEVLVMAKHRFIPVANANDWLTIGNLNAVKLMTMAIDKEEKNLWQEAAVLEGKAVQALDEELKHAQGDGAQVSLNVVYSAINAPGAVEQLM